MIFEYIDGEIVKREATLEESKKVLEGYKTKRSELADKLGYKPLLDKNKRVYAWEKKELKEGHESPNNLAKYNSYEELQEMRSTDHWNFMAIMKKIVDSDPNGEEIEANVSTPITMWRELIGPK
jgi:hypothetical protein